MQVAPVEVVSLCDVDSVMLREAASQVAARQASKKTPRTYGDYRKMLAERDLDLVIVATPDHWHALPMIAAVEAGADVYVEKPISVDVVEGQAMVAAARKHGRVVQVGTQRRSTPHLVEAREEIVRSGRMGRVGSVEIYGYFPLDYDRSPKDTAPPATLDYELWTGPAPMRPFNPLLHPRGWRAFMEYGNGVVGDIGIHMLDMVRWLMDLGAPRRVSSAGSVFVQAGAQGEHHGHPDRDLRLRRAPGRLDAPLLGRPSAPEVPVGGHAVRREGHPQGLGLRLRLRAPRGPGRRPPRREARARGVPRGPDRGGPGGLRRARRSGAT